MWEERPTGTVLGTLYWMSATGIVRVTLTGTLIGKFLSDPQFGRRNGEPYLFFVVRGAARNLDVIACSRFIVSASGTVATIGVPAFTTSPLAVPSNANTLAVYSPMVMDDCDGETRLVVFNEGPAFGGSPKTIRMTSGVDALYPNLSVLTAQSTDYEYGECNSGTITVAQYNPGNGKWINPARMGIVTASSVTVPSTLPCGQPSSVAIFVPQDCAGCLSECPPGFAVPIVSLNTGPCVSIPGITNSLCLDLAAHVVLPSVKMDACCSSVVYPFLKPCDPVTGLVHYQALVSYCGQFDFSNVAQIAW